MFGYDGSDLAKAAIAEADRQLPAGRDALVLTAWRTFHVEFVPEPGAQFDAACADEVKQAAEQTAAAGAALAEAAGFRARGLAIKGTPTWKAISDVADEHDASLIVLGSRGRVGLGGHLVGSVAGAIAAHSRRAVLIVHDHGLAVSRPPEPAQSASPSAAHRPHERAKRSAAPSMSCCGGGQPLADLRCEAPDSRDIRSRAEDAQELAYIADAAGYGPACPR